MQVNPSVNFVECFFRYFTIIWHICTVLNGRRWPQNWELLIFSKIELKKRKLEYNCDKLLGVQITDAFAKIFSCSKDEIIYVSIYNSQFHLFPYKKWWKFPAATQKFAREQFQFYPSGSDRMDSSFLEAHALNDPSMIYDPTCVGGNHWINLTAVVSPAGMYSRYEVTSASYLAACLLYKGVWLIPICR